MADATLTYAELGARIGISADGARMLAKRHGWPKIFDNAGRTLVMVDERVLAERQARSEGTFALPPQLFAHPNGPNSSPNGWMSHCTRIAELQASLGAERGANAEMRDLLGRFLSALERERADWRTQLADTERRLEEAMTDRAVMGDRLEALIRELAELRAERDRGENRFEQALQDARVARDQARADLAEERTERRQAEERHRAELERMAGGVETVRLLIQEAQQAREEVGQPPPPAPRRGLLGRLFGG